MRLVVCARAELARHCAQGLAARLPGVKIDVRDSAAQSMQPDAPADYAMVWKPPEVFFAEQPRLRAVFVLGAGVDALLDMQALPAALPVVRLEDAGMAGPMADYVLAAVLRVYRRFDVYAAHQRAHRWQEELMPPKADFHIGVLGLGQIGAEVARVLVAQGFAVRGYARSPRALAGVACYSGESGWAPFAAGLDMLVNVVPLTLQTQGILCADVFARLRRGAHVINVGRGAQLVEADLLAALDSGQLSGATLDVFSTEPLPENHPFWERSDVVMTPHASAVTALEPALDQIVAKLAAIERGETVSGLVDRARGY